MLYNLRLCLGSLAMLAKQEPYKMDIGYGGLYMHNDPKIQSICTATGLPVALILGQLAGSAGHLGIQNTKTRIGIYRYIAV